MGHPLSLSLSRWTRAGSQRRGWWLALCLSALAPLAVPAAAEGATVRVTKTVYKKKPRAKAKAKAGPRIRTASITPLALQDADEAPVILDVVITRSRQIPSR